MIALASTYEQRGIITMGAKPVDQFKLKWKLAKL